MTIKELITQLTNTLDKHGDMVVGYDTQHTGTAYECTFGNICDADIRTEETLKRWCDIVTYPKRLIFSEGVEMHEVNQ